jgi:hypothetical protein
VHVKNLYNLYVYFWRWALWKVFESEPRPGIVSFITASSYLRGPGFAGMRRYMRELLDELWILDLGGEGRGARKSENVFAIQTPVAIAVAVRYGEPNPDQPAVVHYARIDGTREAKYKALDGIESLETVAWEECYSGWFEPFLPESAADFFSWPALTDIFPWQHSGVQFKRTWPIAPNRETLERRWQQLVSEPVMDRPALFRESRDRKVTKGYPSLRGSDALAPVTTLTPDSPTPPTVSYAYRTLDRQYCFPDNRLGDFLRPVLWHTQSARELYLTSAFAEVLGDVPQQVVNG